MDEVLFQKLSAYIDGELSPQDAEQIKDLLENDPSVAEIYRSIVDADARAREELDRMLELPVPAHLIHAIEAAPPAPANISDAPSHLRVMIQIAASVAFLAVGVVIGQSLSKSGAAPGLETAATTVPPGWLRDIAEYHAVYETQTRHLVEVPASDVDHIEAWLGKTVEVLFETPDLTAVGLTFEGARLLVAAGKPVAQLVYTTESGDVVALCFLKTDKPDTESSKAQQIGGYHMVSWRSNGGAYVVVGPKARQDVIEQAAAQAISL